MSNPKFLLRECRPLDWDDCGSVVTAIIPKPELQRAKYPMTTPAEKRQWRVQWDAGDLRLTDCSRSISWSITDDDSGPNVEKTAVLLDWATKVHEATVKARREYDKLKAAAKRRNEEEGLTEDDDDL